MNKLQPAIGFSQGTVILTELGATNIESLPQGYSLLTQAGGLQPASGIWPVLPQQQDDEGSLVLIKAGNFGAVKDTVLHKTHEVFLSHWLLKALFGVSQAFAPLVHLIDEENVVHCAPSDAIRFHLCLDRGATVFVNGLPIWCTSAQPANNEWPSTTSSRRILTRSQAKQVVDSGIFTKGPIKGAEHETSKTFKH